MVQQKNAKIILKHLHMSEKTPNFAAPNGAGSLCVRGRREKNRPYASHARAANLLLL